MLVRGGSTPYTARELGNDFTVGHCGGNFPVFSPVVGSAPRPAPIFAPVFHPSNFIGGGGTGNRPFTDNNVGHNNGDYTNVETDKFCYRKGDDIDVSFAMSHPNADDWVGIYPAHIDHDYVGDPIMWLHTCGNQYCWGEVAHDTLTFGEGPLDESGTYSWPLRPGEYTVLLLQGTEHPRVLAFGNDFMVIRSNEYCGNPSPIRPPPAPQPTRPPAPRPCNTYIYTNSQDYDGGEDVVVTFENCQPEEGDWVGIYHADSHPDDLYKPLLWLYSCGSQHCSGRVSNGMVTFGHGDPNESGVIYWPLPNGHYVAYLIRETSSPYHAFAVSDTFTVSGY